jgi:hypothetical protein
MPSVDNHGSRGETLDSDVSLESKLTAGKDSTLKTITPPQSWSGDLCLDGDKFGVSAATAFPGYDGVRRLSWNQRSLTSVKDWRYRGTYVGFGPIRNAAVRELAIPGRLRESMEARAAAARTHEPPMPATLRTQRCLGAVLQCGSHPRAVSWHTGTKPSPLSIATLGAVARMAIGHSATFGRLNPTMQHARVEPTCQGDRRDRDAGLLARTYRFGLKMFAGGSSMTTNGLDQLSHSIHVHAYRLN